MKKMSELTPAELRKAATRYDNIHNEGGEGYNPYRTEQERRELEACKNRPESLYDKKERLTHELRITDSSIARECMTYDANKVARLRTEIEEIETEIQKALWEEWTPETTKARQEEWNSFIRSLGEIDGRVMLKVYAKEREQGWGREDLKRALKHHGLMK